MKQGSRFMQCQNPILTKDLSKHTINYMKPLEFGGIHNIENSRTKMSNLYYI